MTEDHLSEIREGDAPPEIALIYHDIRQAIGIPLVNLVYRHLATMPGVLPWVWHVARQPVSSGAVDEARRRILKALDVPKLDPTANQGVSVGSGDLKAIDGVLNVYNRGNVTNMILLSMVLKLLAGTASEAGSAVTSARDHSVEPLGPMPTIPPLPRIGDLAPDVAALVRGLAMQRGGADAKVIPSLYLHLAYWPGFLRQIRERLEPKFRDGSFGRATVQMCDLAEKEVQKLSRGVFVEFSPPPGTVQEIRQTLTMFTTRVIPEMIPVGATIQRFLVGL